MTGHKRVTTTALSQLPQTMKQQVRLVQVHEGTNSKRPIPDLVNNGKYNAKSLGEHHVHTKCKRRRFYGKSETTLH